MTQWDFLLQTHHEGRPKRFEMWDVQVLLFQHVGFIWMLDTDVQCFCLFLRILYVWFVLPRAETAHLVCIALVGQVTREWSDGVAAELIRNATRDNHNPETWRWTCFVGTSVKFEYRLYNVDYYILQINMLIIVHDS